LPRRPYLLKKLSRVWYYRLAGEITFHTTGETTRTAAELHVNGLIGDQILRPPDKIRLREFTEGFFDQDSPWVRRRDALTLEEIKDLFSKDRSEPEKKWGNLYWATLCYLALTADFSLPNRNQFKVGSYLGVMTESVAPVSQITVPSN
jgi:hypothetical protein